MNLEKKDIIELVMALLAVIAGSIAASGAFVSASYERQRVALEEKPTLLLACEPEFRSLDVAQGLKPEANAAFLSKRRADWIHIAERDSAQTPAAFARCSLNNYGRLPLVNLRLTLSLEGRNTFLDVAGLGSSERFTFSLINGTNANLHFAFVPVAKVTRVDTGSEDSVVLFLSRSLVALQNRTIEPAER